MWPSQACPSSWATWKQALAKLYLKDTSAAHRPVTTLYLCSHLGCWYSSFSCDCLWPAYQDFKHLFIQDTVFRHQHSFLGYRDLLTGQLPSCNFEEQPYGHHHNPMALDSIVPANPKAARRGH